MSTTATKRPHPAAYADALVFQRFFDGRFERWDIAGSVRRRCAEVGDVDHVVIPRFAEKPGPGLFAEPVRINLVLERLDELVADGVITKHVYGASGFRWGELQRGADFRGFNHEVSLCGLDNWGSKLAIKTGPEEFSKLLVTRLNIRRYRNIDGYVWRCEPCRSCSPQSRARGIKCDKCDDRDLAPIERVSVPTERDYFALASTPYLEPHARR